ncbi:hypothetical protein ACWYRQ_06420 [Clostridioides difficile]
MKNYLKKRVGNRGFWISLAAMIPLTIQSFGYIEILPKNYSDIVNCFLALLTALGILNDNSTENKWYLDDK